MLPVLFLHVLKDLLHDLKDTLKRSTESDVSNYNIDIPMPHLMKKMMTLMGRIADGETNERKMSEELFQAISHHLPHIMSRISFLPDDENWPSISILKCLLRKKSQDLLKDARAVLFASCEYLGEVLPCNVKAGQECILKICGQLLEMKAQPASSKRGGRAPQPVRMAKWDEGRSHFNDEMSKYILPRYTSSLKQTDNPLLIVSIARSLQRSIPILQMHAVSLAPKISSLISNASSIPPSVKLDILETLIFEIVSSGSSSTSRVCTEGDWVSLRSPVENGRPTSDPQWIVLRITRFTS